MTFVNLHAHTTYSFLDGYGKPDQIVSRLQELDQKASAITDHGNIFAHVPVGKAMIKAGIKPIYGCEFYIVDNMFVKEGKHQKSLGVDGERHVTVFAMTQNGYTNLLKLSTLSWHDGFYYKPRIDWQTLAKYQEGLCVLSGCVGGYPSTLILKKGPEAAYNFILERRAQIEHYYIELIPQPGLGISTETFPVLMDIAMATNTPMVMTSDAHFPRPEDHIGEDTMLCIGLRTTMMDKERKIKLEGYQHYGNEVDILKRVYDQMLGMMTPEREQMLIGAIHNTGIIADNCEVEIPHAKQLLFPGIGEKDDATVLWSWVEDGFRHRRAQGWIDDTNEGIYRERAHMEFSLMKEKGFCHYILCLTDICRWAKAQDTLVMCRGSAGGCLLLWLLGCSETNSVLHDLDFNRFMDVSRMDPPDIDVDFETKMKQPVYEYISKKYGADNVCQILALGLIRARVAVQDVAAVYGIPREEYSPLSAALDSKDDDVDLQIANLRDPAALAVLHKYPIFGMIDQLVGQARQNTIHAAGVLISSEPLTNTIAVCEQPGKPRVSSVDKHGAMDLGFLKLDLLTVMQYDVLADAVRAIGANMSWLYNLRFDDAEVYRLAKTGRVTGVFQLDGAAIRIGSQIGLDRFDEIYAVSALCRPGAADFVPLYQDNKFNPQAFQKFLTGVHPLAADIVRPTYGVLLYQEQVMKICNRLGKIPMDRVQKLRKRIANASFHGKELGAEYGDDFVRGAMENGCTESEAKHWWEAIKAHGIYSFNKAHCVTYGIVGYWMLYMMSHYPAAYFESYLKHEGASSSSNQLLMKRLIREFRRHGGEVQMIDPVLSRSSFYSPRPGLIVGGWRNLSGIGENTAEKIMAGGPYRDWKHLQQNLPVGLYYKLHEAGMTGAMRQNVPAMVELAPWMPVQFTGPQEQKIREQLGLARPSDLPEGEKLSGDSLVCGYVTAIQKKARTGHFKGETIIYVCEDETGAIEFRIPYKQTQLAQSFRNCIKLGDFIAIQGWWAGEMMFLKNYELLHRRQ